MTEMTEFDPWTCFALQTAERAIELVNQIGAGGTEVVSVREGAYRYWDPETLKVDQVLEDLYIEQVKEKKLSVVLLSEERGKLEITHDHPPEGMTEKVYLVCDPFDGSLLYKRQIPAFWYTALALYTLSGEPICGVVGDCSSRSVDFADRKAAYTAELAGGKLDKLKKLEPRDTQKLSDAFIETYLMKPHYMYPAVKALEPLLSKVKFIHPNGGPSGFTDVAAGRVDVYLAHKQPLVDVFPGLAVAQRAGVLVTTFTGEPPVFSDDINSRFNLVCSGNQKLHEEVLEVLSECTLSD